MQLRRPYRMTLAAGALATLGCGEILGYESSYVEAPAGTAEVGPEFRHAEGKADQSCEQDVRCGMASCCEKDRLPGGTFPMGSDDPEHDYDEVPVHNVTISPVLLDRFEVTVGRFRGFVDALDAGWRPLAGAAGIPGVGDSGWLAEWDQQLPSSRDESTENLKCMPFASTWTDTPGTTEDYPQNCVNWYEAFAFCIWDGGRLPTEAEWEFAAKGGPQDRLYPWGAEPIPDCSRVQMADCPEGEDSGLKTTPFVAVGSRPQGAARFGHLDLAGSLWEWVFDAYDDVWYEGRGEVCSDCANATPGPRVDRGGSFSDSEQKSFRSSYRGKDIPQNRADWLGFRCARRE